MVQRCVRSRKQDDRGSRTQPSSGRARRSPVCITSKLPVFVVSCHICSLQRNIANRNLIKNGTWVNIQCRVCRANRKANKWRCECMIPWHTCSIHRSHGLLCKSSAKSPNPPQACSSSGLSPLGHTHKPGKGRKLKARARHMGTVRDSRPISFPSASKQRTPANVLQPVAKLVRSFSSSVEPPLPKRQRSEQQVNDTRRGCKRKDHTVANALPFKRKATKGATRGVSELSMSSLLQKNPRLAAKFPHLTGRPPD